MRSIAVTGVSGYLGRLLLWRLDDDPSVEQVVGLDVKEPPARCARKLVFYRQDINEPMGPLFERHRVEAAVHLVYVLRPVRDRRWATQINVEGTRNFLAACHHAKVGRILYPSSTSVYGAWPDNPVPLTEAHPPRPKRGFQYSYEKRETEDLCREYAREHPEATVVIARGAPGLGPDATNWIGRTLVGGAGLQIWGYDPPLQFVHDDDFAAALHTLLAAAVPGTFNVGGEGTVPYSAVAREANRLRMAVPAPVLYSAAGLSWRLRLQSASPPEGLDYIRYPWIASSEKLKRETGFAFRYTSLEALRAYVAAWKAARERRAASPSDA